MNIINAKIAKVMKRPKPIEMPTMRDVVLSGVSSRLEEEEGGKVIRMTSWVVEEAGGGDVGEGEREEKVESWEVEVEGGGGSRVGVKVGSEVEPIAFHLLELRGDDSGSRSDGSDISFVDEDGEPEAEPAVDGDGLGRAGWEGLDAVADGVEEDVGDIVGVVGFGLTVVGSCRNVVGSCLGVAGSFLGVVGSGRNC